MEEKAKKLGSKTTAEQGREELHNATWNTPEMNKMKESFQRRFGFDMTDRKEFPVTERGFSWKKAHELLESKHNFREAEVSSSWNQLLRAGVQNIMIGAYESVPTTFEDWAHVIQSSLDTELYAPLHGIQFPSEVATTEVYPEVQAAGLDIKLKNRKYGQIFAVSLELSQDDQTGQMMQQVKLIGEYLKLVLEVLAYGKLASVSGAAYLNLRIDTTETKPSYESNYPRASSAAPLRGGGVTKPTSFGALTQANIQSGMIALMNQLNLLGVKMLVDPSRLLISPHYKFDSAVLANSSYYPSGAASAGAVGGALAINPLKGLFDITVSRFMFDQNGSVNADSKAWYLVDGSKPWFVVQVREAVSVQQENPASGQSFDRDVIRFKGLTRCAADYIDPRFSWQGSDGSV